MNSLQYEQANLNLAIAWKMLVWLLIIQLMVSFVGRSLAPLTVLIEKEFSLTNTQIGLIPAALFWGQSLIAIPAGLLVDRFGSKLILFGTVIALGISFIFLAISSHFYLLLLAVVFGGGAYGAVHPPTNRGILYWFPQKSRGTAMGIKQMGITVGSALAALSLLPFAKEVGWRPALVVSCLCLMVIGILAVCSYKEPSNNELLQRKTFSKSKFMKDLKQTFQNRKIIMVSISAMGLQGAQLCLTTYIVLFAYGRLDFTLLVAGMLLVLAEIGGSVGRVVWGMISDSLFNGKRIIVLFIVTILSGVCSILVSLMNAETSVIIVMTIVLFFGFCISGYNGVWMTTIVEAAPKEHSGIATGITLTISSWGVILIPPAFGFIVDKFGSFSYGWIFLALIMAFVTVTLAFVKDKKALS